jgi:hypothetical protein
MGERTGIPDLNETVVALSNLNGETKYELKALLPISTYVEKVSGFFLAPNKPVSGVNAFSHKSGVHTNGVLKDPRTYEPFDPALLGRERRIVIDKYTGKLAVTTRLESTALQVSDQELEAIVEADQSGGRHAQVPVRCRHHRNRRAGHAAQPGCDPARDPGAGDDRGGIARVHLGGGAALEEFHQHLQCLRNHRRLRHLDLYQGQRIPPI